ncbi:MAG: hypothetical protein U5K37_08265 [Natrialbaceae archaeon]|nr:hypothetical protein [Natrialbaceae archaeon]
MSQADIIEFLELTGEILVPRTVLQELERGPTDISELEYTVEEVAFDTDTDYPHLDPGETAALSLCRT